MEDDNDDDDDDERGIRWRRRRGREAQEGVLAAEIIHNYICNIFYSSL